MSGFRDKIKLISKQQYEAQMSSIQESYAKSIQSLRK